MKLLLKLEDLGLLILFTLTYNYFFPHSFGMYFALFFVPDISFAAYLISSKVGSVAYNILHHKGAIALIVITGMFLKNDEVVKIGLIFMAHSSFDRVAGYGLKFADSFDHTHLGWIGKSKNKNVTN